MSAEASVADAISAFPSNVSPSDQNQLVLTRGELNRIIADAMKEVSENIDDLRAEVAEERAFDRKRISRLEKSNAVPSRQQTERLNKLDKSLVSRRNQAMTFSEIGKILELGSRAPGKNNTRRQAMTKFSKLLISKPDRYIVFQSKTVGGKMVRLVDEYYNDLACPERG